MDKLLDVQNMVTAYQTESGEIRAVDGISFDVKKGETVCIVGESGSGKSVTSMSIMRLVDYENGQVTEGAIHFKGDDLTKKSQSAMRKIRGSQISMIFQEPMTALNPVFTVGRQIMEAIRFHRSISKSEARTRGAELLRLVGISDPDTRMNQYPHELSGGMRQRVMIAIALACEPELLIADEPTTALDVTIEAQILELLQKLKEEMDMAILLITHDIGVAAEVSDRMVVMYAGKVMEIASTKDVFDAPFHPYTKGLFESVPSMEGERGVALPSIKGTIPSLSSMPVGCRFSPRCPYATEQCLTEEPPLEQINTRQVACWEWERVVQDTSQKPRIKGGVGI
ncbi:peptide ABC transporter ATP-binding protein [Alteribacter lacisalsi]|uniref:Peptide ABC transporter ATP-binding protein n=1 Tax=Alteribacter lacisalsi TaxID=2045244 RepID=A0A2W0HGK9_9BACI|nr:ABC transporter ATP-binding protein [Alteribacter lacisalsi]PYZ95929.1 peptide ABC transporter ATP-binding protein [Alteribacter lacisalsi]